jgi:Zn-dependent protease with chaperone function
MRYTRAKSTYSLSKSAFDLIVFFAFWFLGGFPWLDSFCSSFHFSEIVTGLIFFASLALASQVFNLPFEIYFTFVLEESFGFNKTTPMTFVKDHVKVLLLSAVIGGPVLAVVLWFLSTFGTGAWLWVFLFITAFQLTIVFLMPAVILPLFLEMIPLPSGTALITNESGDDGKSLPGFLSGRAFYARDEEHSGKPCWVTNDRRFAGSKSGATLAISWSLERNEWLLGEGLPDANDRRIYATSASTTGDWHLTAEALAEASTKERAQEGASSVSDPLVQTSDGQCAEKLKVISIDAGSLKNNLLALADRLGYHGASIFVIDGSSRSAHSNAFCIGFGNLRRICLFDTLLPLMSEGEILAVLGHEIGHDRLYHVHSRLVIGIAYSFVMLYALGHFLFSPELCAAFFAPVPKVYLGVIFFSMAWGAVDFVFSVIMSAESRSNEFAADRFAVEADRSYGELLGAALKKLMKKSKVNLTPHPFQVFLTYSHPPLDARLQAIRDFHRQKYAES